MIKNKLIIIALTIISITVNLFAAPLVGVTNGSRVTFFDSSTPGTLNRYSGDNTGTNEYLNGYQVFNEQGKIVGNLTDITVAPDGTFYGMTHNGDFYRFSDFGRYQNNQLGFKMELVKDNLPKGSVDFIDANTIGILSNNELSVYDAVTFNLLSQQNISNQYAGLTYDNNGTPYSIKYSPSPSRLNVVNGVTVVNVPNGNSQSDLAYYDNIFYLNINGKIYTYDEINNNLTLNGNEAITLQSIDYITPEPSVILMTVIGTVFLTFRRRYKYNE